MDKVAHFLACVLISLVVAIIFEKTTVGTPWAYAFMGAFAAVLVGIFKEIFDFLYGDHFDAHDLLADFIGAVIGFLLTAILLHF